MPAPTPPTEGEREARAAYIEAKNDVALLIEAANRGFAHGEGDGYAELLLDLSRQAPKLTASARRLRHNLGERADVALPDPPPPPSEAMVFCVVWPDGEVFTSAASTWWSRDHKFTALRSLQTSRGLYPELRLYDARNGVFVEEES
jgi:hypothetical protein